MAMILNNTTKNQSNIGIIINKFTDKEKTNFTKMIRINLSMKATITCRDWEKFFKITERYRHILNQNLY